jgi:hypothetical protein
VVSSSCRKPLIESTRAKSIQCRSLEVVDDLGFVASIVEKGIVDLPDRFHSDDGSVHQR